MKILSDMHHAGLFFSLQLLFEKRFGFELYRPIGMDWYEEGFWNVYPHIDTARQYLLDGFIPKDHTPSLNSVTKIENGIHHVWEGSQMTTHKALTLEQFKSMKFDMVIASMPAHIEPFKRLIATYQPEAKFVFQMGNMFHEVINNLHTIPNLLSSTIEIPVPGNCNAVFYHQEFNMDLFKPTTIEPKKKITSFINLLPQTNHAPLWYTMKQDLYDYEFKSYGILTDDGILSGLDNISIHMQQSMWGWHCKFAGDGFGHILYNWFASGRPVIIKSSDYKDKLGGELLVDETTCIDLDAHSPTQAYELIRKYSEKTPYEYLCQQAYARFKEKVNYEKETEKIKEWLGRLR